MKRIALVITLLHAVLSVDEPAPDFKPVFNGKDLTGWDGNPEL